MENHSQKPSYSNMIGDIKIKKNNILDIFKILVKKIPKPGGVSNPDQVGKKCEC